MKKTLTALYIIAILLPMLFYLHPFVWGLRKAPSYQPSEKTELLIKKLNEKHKLKIFLAENKRADSLWYFIDVRNGTVKQLKNFELYHGFSSVQRSIEINDFKNYADDFLKEFEHKQYFDSIIITKDTLKYKAKIK
ncbi:MAG: hypothetical protein KIG55_07570 [Myroides sp.]|nr:hypothetical protein [Myroides sp.]